MNPNDPAFPSGEKETEAQYGKEPYHAGLTVRQYYKALLAPEFYKQKPEYREAPRGDQFRWIAAYAGELADALIAEDQEHAKKVTP